MRAQQAEETQPEDLPARGTRWTRLVVLGFIAALFAGLLFGKVILQRPSAQTAPASTASATSTRNDASRDYDAAMRTGKPIFVLFHSLS